MNACRARAFTFSIKVLWRVTYAVHVGVETADPLCVELNDLIKRGKIPKEPMLSHEIPQGPWKFISQDLFKQGGVGILLR